MERRRSREIVTLLKKYGMLQKRSTSEKVNATEGSAF